MPKVCGPHLEMDSLVLAPGLWDFIFLEGDMDCPWHFGQTQTNEVNVDDQCNCGWLAGLSRFSRVFLLIQIFNCGTQLTPQKHSLMSNKITIWLLCYPANRQGFHGDNTLCYLSGVLSHSCHATSHCYAIILHPIPLEVFTLKSTTLRWLCNVSSKMGDLWT